jgi:hypothetical protein
MNREMRELGQCGCGEGDGKAKAGAEGLTDAEGGYGHEKYPMD